MRRVVLVLLVLALAPSTAAASWYRCAYDGVTRSACCCPANAHRAKTRTPASAPSLRAACCCTVTHVTRAAPPGRADDATPAPAIDPAAAPIAAWLALPAPGRGAAVAIARPRAQDPPDTLLRRRCSLLL